MSPPPTLADLEKRWVNAQRVWNRSGSTDHVRIIQLGEDMLFAASDLISELRSERDDLADELDNVRSAFRDRWAAFGSKGGE